MVKHCLVGTGQCLINPPSLPQHFFSTSSFFSSSSWPPPHPPSSYLSHNTTALFVLEEFSHRKEENPQDLLSLIFFLQWVFLPSLGSLNWVLQEPFSAVSRSSLGVFMAHSNSKVPQFGSWEEADENVAYTAYFETARKGKSGGPIINPNEISMNRDVAPPARSATPHSQTKLEPKQPKFGEWDDGEEVPYTAYFENPRKGKPKPNEPQMNWDVGPALATKSNPPPVAKAGKVDEALPRVDNASVRSGDSHQRHGGRISSGDPHGKPNAVKFAGGRSSFEQSPIHPRMGGRGGVSQPSSSDSFQGGRPRQKPPVRGAQSPIGGGASVPAFGDWNKNPGQADGYTLVFDQLQKDRRGGAGTTPGRDANSTPYNKTPGRATERKTEGNWFSRLFGCFSSAG